MKCSCCHTAVEHDRIGFCGVNSLYWHSKRITGHHNKIRFLSWFYGARFGSDA